MKNFLPLSRDIQEHWVYQDNDYFKAWVEFLFNARFSRDPKTDIFKGTMYTINYGEFLYSRPSYSLRLNITDSKLRNFMDHLIKDEMIEKVFSLGKNKPTIYRIKNYEKYNFLPTEQPSEDVANKGLKSKSNQVRAKSQPSGHQVASTKEERKIEKIEKINNIIDPFTSNPYLKQTLLDFVDMRSEINKPITIKGMEALLKKLVKLGNNDLQMIEILENSIANSWQGIFELKKVVQAPVAQKQKPTFNNHTNRTYDGNALEQQLLAASRNELIK